MDRYVQIHGVHGSEWKSGFTCVYTKYMIDNHVDIVLDCKKTH